LLQISFIPKGTAMSEVIVGGGIQGLSIGWYLARAGRSVTIVERGEAGHEATWASAGMLAPHVATATPAETLRSRLVLNSHALWPNFADELQQASSIAIGYRTEGSLVTAHDQPGIERITAHHNLQHEWGIDTQWLSGDEARKLEPHLASDVIAAVFSEIDHQVDNRKVAQALRGAFLSAGGELREHTPVTEILFDNERARGVRCSNETLEASTIILAAGAWSASIAGLPNEVIPPVRPVKGQILAVQMPLDGPLVRHLVWGHGVYLIPRLDGRLIVGATVEEQGFDTQLTAGAVLGLLQSACATIPAIRDLPIHEMWVGLRPGSLDDAPILGTTAIRGLILATGHFAHGIVLAPITAKAICHFILTGETLADMHPFAPSRFSQSGT
jgi:glycine oxidase